MRHSLLGLMAAIFCMLLAFSASAATSSESDEGTGWYGPGPMMGPGMMHGYGQYGMGPDINCPRYAPDMMQGYGPREMGPGGYGMGPGMMGGYGMYEHGGGFGYGMGQGMMMGFGMLHALNLSDEQREKVTHIMDGQRKEIWKQMGDMMDAREKLQDLFAMDEPDPGKVGAAYADISRIRQNMIETVVKSRNEIWKVLTKEQRQQLHDWRRGNYGHKRGMMRR